MPAKREVIVGFSLASAYNQQPASPQEVLVGESFDIKGEPTTYEQINNMTPDNLEINSAGFNYSFDVSGCEPNIRQLGRLLAIALGGDSIVSDKHQIVPTNGPSRWLALYRDLKVAIGGGSLTTEVPLGAKINAFTIEVMRNAFLKLGFGGNFCDMGEPIAGLTAVAPTFPLSWHSLRAGDYKIGFGGDAPVSERTIHSIKMTYSREQDLENNINLDSDQPDDITEGGRTFDFEITRKLVGAAAIAEYQAQKSGTEVAIEFTLVADPDGSPQTFTVSVPHLQITGSYTQPTGTGTDPVMAILKCRAKKVGADNLLTITADDGTVVAWAPIS